MGAVEGTRDYSMNVSPDNMDIKNKEKDIKGKRRTY